MVGHVRSLNQDVAREFVLDAEVPVQHVGCRLKSPVRGVPGALAKQRKKTPAAACDERHPERERVVDEIDWFDVSIGSIESAVDSRAASKGEPVLSATAVSRGLVITGPIHYSESPAENGLWERAVGKAGAGSPVVGVHFIQTAAETFLAGEAQTSGQIRVSSAGDATAGPDGAANFQGQNRAKYPVPVMPVGGLIGRVGNSRPFPIGANSQPITMPENGKLYLGINDDEVSDNSGTFTVTISR